MKKFFKTFLIIAAVLVVLVILLALLNKDDETSAYDPTENFSDFAWPDSELVNRIPRPEKIYGEINHEETGSFSADLGDVTKEQFETYMNDCIDAGFIVDYHKTSDVYWAYDADGYYLYISYDNEHKMMDVSVREPQKETTTTTAPANGLGKDFKAAMDAYEDFVDEYVAIFKKYQANPSDMSILADYTDYMTRYAEVCATFEEWENEDLSTEELAYYVDVQARVSKKLIELAQ